MPRLIIDGRAVEVPTGRTVLEAARELGVGIPTLCFRDGFRPSTSCMVCIVLDRNADRLIPSCSALAAEGMVIETDSEEVCEARRDALELLLSDHVGDCDAPCRRACPAHMDIPAMIRQIAAGWEIRALMTVKQQIPLPGVLGRICSAPCEKACRRAQHDAAVSVCLLKRYAADVDWGQESPWLPVCKPCSGKRVAIAGAGPTGLSAAYYLLQEGHACTLLDRHERPGGALRHELFEGRLPQAVLDAEIDVVLRLGAEFEKSRAVGSNVSARELRQQYDAVVIATGPATPADIAEWGVDASEHGIRVDPRTFATSETGIFAAGSAVHRTHMAARAVGQGRAVALSVDAFLREDETPEIRRRSSSKLGVLLPGEMEEFLQHADPGPRVEPAGGSLQGLSRIEAEKEAARCLGCDCRKRDSCRLRVVAERYGARQSRYRGRERSGFERVHEHPDIVYEPGKCIKCGLCIQVTERSDRAGGLSFIGRGFGVRVGAPLGGSLAEALGDAAAECVEVCPTGALALRGAK